MAGPRKPLSERLSRAFGQGVTALFGRSRSEKEAGEVFSVAQSRPGSVKIERSTQGPIKPAEQSAIRTESSVSATEQKAPPPTAENMLQADAKKLEHIHLLPKNERAQRIEEIKRSILLTNTELESPAVNNLKSTLLKKIEDPKFEKNIEMQAQFAEFQKQMGQAKSVHELEQRVSKLHENIQGLRKNESASEETVHACVTELQSIRREVHELNSHATVQTKQQLTSVQNKMNDALRDLDTITNDRSKQQHPPSPRQHFE